MPAALCLLLADVVREGDRTLPYPAETPPESVGTRIGRLRRERNISQRQLALAAAVSSTYLSKIEAGQRRPSLEVVRRFAPALGVTATYLETGRDRGGEVSAERLAPALHECLKRLEQASSILQRALRESSC